MRFTSWWNEDGKRTYMKIFFYTNEKVFKVQVDCPMMVEIQNRYGVPLDCWDLHVGASLKILGRNVTLKKASGETQEWLDWQVGRHIST